MLKNILWSGSNSLEIRFTHLNWEETGIQLSWELILNQQFGLGKGYGHSIEDGLCQAAQAIINFFAQPVERRNYVSIQETPVEDKDFWSRLEGS